MRWTFGVEPLPESLDVASLMRTVAGEKQIPLGGALYERGLEQLRSNLERLLARYAEAGVPVFIGTLACNERDHPPFDGGPAQGSAAEDSADAWFARARAFDAAGDFEAALRSFHAIANDSYLKAETTQEIAKALSAQGDHDSAYTWANSLSSPRERVGAFLGMAEGLVAH